VYIRSISLNDLEHVPHIALRKLEVVQPIRSWLTTFLPRCMERRRGLAMRILSVCPYVCLPNACIVTKR